MFNIVEVAEMMKGLKKANDENRDLEAKLRKTEGDLNELKVEHEVAQECLADLETYYARERTKPAILRVEKN